MRARRLFLDGRFVPMYYWKCNNEITTINGLKVIMKIDTKGEYVFISHLI